MMEDFKYPAQFEDAGVLYATPPCWPSLCDIKKDLKLTSSDILLAGYPKSGTHWLADILHYIRVGPEAARARTDNLEELVPYPELLRGGVQTDNIPFYNLLAKPHPWTLRSHLCASFFESSLNTTMLTDCNKPSNTGPKFICLLRNPKDILVSYYHFHKILPYGLADLAWNDFFDYFSRGKTLFGDPIDHNLSWWKYRDHPNVMFVHYEDMLQDGAGEVRRLADFLGCTYSSEEIDIIVKATSFDVMKAQPLSYYFEVSDIYQPGEMSPLQRKGIKGDWLNFFSDEQNEHMSNLLQTKTDPAGLFYKF